MQIMEKSPELSKFTKSRGHGAVFSSSRGAGDSRLFFGALGDRAGAKLNEKPSSGAVSSWAIGPVRVRVGGDL